MRVTGDASRLVTLGDAILEIFQLIPLAGKFTEKCVTKRHPSPLDRTRRLCHSSTPMLTNRGVQSKRKVLVTRYKVSTLHGSGIDKWASLEYNTR